MNTLSPRIIVLVAGVVAVFIMIALAQEMNRRLQIQREIARLEGEVYGLEKTIIEMENLNQYFRTDAFRERMAREKLNFRGEGEKVVLLPADVAGASDGIMAAEEMESYSIPRRWWNAFFVVE